MINWAIETRNIKDLKNHPHNPRKLSTHDADHLKQSIQKFGLIDKPIITKEGLIIGGHQRISILKKMGVKQVECYVPDKELEPKDIDELNIRLNRNVGEWDWDILANSFDITDLTQWGFTAEDLSIESPELEIDSVESEENKTTCPKCGHEF